MKLLIVLISGLLTFGPVWAGTPDGFPPANEGVCDELIGGTPGLYGLCVARGGPPALLPLRGAAPAFGARGSDGSLPRDDGRVPREPGARHHPPGFTETVLVIR